MTDSTAVARVERSPLSTTTQIEHSVAVEKATLLAKSSVIPKEFQGQPGNILVALEYANRLGCSVLAVMQNLDVIHGRPSLRSTFLIGTVNASGRFTPIRFRWEGTPGADDWGCRAAAIDRESGEECVGPLITIQLAKDEGWYSKQGSKWKTIPELMLSYRAGAWWTRIYCPELALGLHTTDEVEDMGPSARVHAETVSAALHGADLPEARVEVVQGDPPAAGATQTARDPRRERLRLQYVGLLEERGMSGDGDRSAFEARLRKDGLVSGGSSDEWGRQDYLSAIAELDEVPVEQNA